ncbi:hypothetical protein PGT21_014648 [Puccinia graminis f. sp. tritici]|nr:hypothetical protein PGT21_014648 [Puccinia graminis f. sp. tritici]
MAQSIGLGQASADDGPAVPIVDSYVKGMSKLQHEFTNRGLNRLRPYSPGILSMIEEDELRDSQQNSGPSGELDAEHNSDDNSSSEDNEDRQEALED